MYDKTHDEKQAVGWCPAVLDTNGDGKITKPWNEPVGGGRSQEEGGGGGRSASFDPKLDTRVNVGSYGVDRQPDRRGGVVIVDELSGSDRAVGHRQESAGDVRERDVHGAEQQGADHFGPRGIDVDRNGVVWMALSGSGGFASFDRRKCKVFNGPSVVEGSSATRAGRSIR